MSEENVEVVRRVTEMGEEAIRRDDLGAGFDECVARGLIATNVEYQAGPRGGTGVAGLDDVVGRDGLVQFLRRWTEDFHDLETEYEGFIDAGDDRVLVLMHSSGTGKASGVPVEIRTAALYELEAGCIVRVFVFLRPEDAFKAAGLEE